MVKKNAIMRYKILDSMLSNRNRKYTMGDLLENVNQTLLMEGMDTVSRRCIEMDLNALSLPPYSAPIERAWIEGAKYIRYEEEGFSIFTKKLSNEEENLLSEVLNTIGQFDGINNFEWLDGLKRRLNIKEHRKIIQFDTSPYLRNSKHIGKLFTAISNKQVLRLKYQKFYTTEPKEFIVHPYLLKEYNKRWYLLGRVKSGDIRNFAIDRLNSFKYMPKIQYIEPDSELEERFEDIIGITLYTNKPVEDILIWVSNEGYPYVMTKPLHSSQMELKGERHKALAEKYNMLGEGHFFRLKCILNYELEQAFMAKMEQLVVLEPAKLVSSISNRINKLNTIYTKLTT